MRQVLFGIDHYHDYGRTDSPSIRQNVVPFGSPRGRCPAYTTATNIKYWSRARVPINIPCLRATIMCGKMNVMINKTYGRPLSISLYFTLTPSSAAALITLELSSIKKI